MSSSQSQDSAAVNTGSESTRLEALPTELITLIANHLDIKSLRQLRLSSRRLDAASSHAFKLRLACVSFWFMEASMQRLALLSKSSRWSQHVKTLAIMASCPEKGERRSSELAYPPVAWTLRSSQMRHFGLHLYRLPEDPAAAGGEESETLRFGTMPNAHTLVLHIGSIYPYGICSGSLLDVDQHRSLPALYAALPNLTTLQLRRVDVGEARSSDSLRSLVPLALLSITPSLRCLGIGDGYFESLQEAIDLVRRHKDYLRSVEIRRTFGNGWVGLLRVLQHELPFLENVVFEDNEMIQGDRMRIEWSDGTCDNGQHAREMIREKGVKRTLGEMIAGLNR
ncbi:hypothetical protein BFW01_g12822 [Lasiodiplodia theobromae]|nr:hypothetical protein BFW01_g12822 [Lasiodiplodia theobromae]